MITLLIIEILNLLLFPKIDIKTNYSNIKLTDLANHEHEGGQV